MHLSICRPVLRLDLLNLMKTRKFLFGSVILPAAAFVSFSASANAAAITWDNGGANQLWSNPTNWNPDGAAAGNEITFDATAASTTAGTVTNIVDANVSVNTLLFNNVGTATQTTQINSGQTLTVSGALAGAFTVNNTTASSSNVTITGAGTLAITGGQTTTTFNVGSATAAAGGTTQVLNMAGLANFSASVATFNIGNGQRGAGTVTLGATNSITANTIQLGGNTTTGGLTSTLNLGQTNTINATTIISGSGRSSGNINFAATGLTGTPTVTIRGVSGGSSTANLTVGNGGNVSASGVGSGTVDFSLGSVDALLGTVNLGSGSLNGAGSATGTLTFGLGTITATTITLGNGNASTSTSTGFGVVNMNANAGTLTATTVNVGSQTNAGATVLGNATGTFNQNGGTAVITTLNLGNRAATTAGANVTSTYNLAAGTLKAGTIQAGGNGTGTGTVTRTFNWTGGTIQNLNSTTDLTIASTNGLSLNLNGVGTQKFTADTGRNIAVNAVMTGSGGFTKDGLGTLTLSGVNNYNGTTTISGGTLALTGTGSISSSQNIIVGASTTFDVSGVTGGYTLASSQTLSGAGNVAGSASIAGTLSPGSSPGTLNTGSQIWLNGGDYNWQILDATGPAGTGYDTIALTGTLDLSVLTAGGFGINLWSLSSIGPDVSGNAANFNSLLDQSWTLLTTTGGITGFDSSNFTISVGANNGTGGFTNALDPEHGFQIAKDGNNLVLTYAAVPEPNAAMLIGGFGVIALLRRRRA
jgi:hypothetical protein